MVEVSRLMSPNQNEAGESLKNVLLVLNSSQLLIPPPASGSQDERTDLQKEIWDKSHLRIGKILPGFLEDFVASPGPRAAPPPAPRTPAEHPAVEKAEHQDASAKEIA